MAIDVEDCVASLCAAAEAGASPGAWRNSDGVVLTAGCQAHAGGVSQIAVETKRCRLVLVGGNSGGLSVLDLHDLSRPPRAAILPSSERGGAAHAGRVNAVAWLPHDSRLFISCAESCLKIWDAAAMAACAAEVSLRSPIAAAALTDGPPACAALALGDGSVRLVDLRQAVPVLSLTGHSRPPMCVTWGKPGTHRLVSGGLDGTVRAWDSRMGARSLFLFDPYALDVDASAPKKTPSAEEIRRKDQEEHGPQRSINMSFKFEPYRFKPMKSFLGTSTGNSSQGFASAGPSSRDSELNPLNPHAQESDQEQKDRLMREKWKLEAEKKARHFRDPPKREYEHEPSVAHSGAVIAVTMQPLSASAASPYLFSCGVDGKVRCWEEATGYPSGEKASFDVECWSKELGLQIGAHGAPYDVVFVPEGKHVAAYCSRTGEQLCRLAAHTSDVNCVAAVPGRPEMLSGSNDGRILCWRGCAEAPRKPEQVICLD